MKNKTLKNILIISISLFIIMLIATTIVLTFNSYLGFSTDTNDENVATGIAAIAFLIALILRFFYYK